MKYISIIRPAALTRMAAAIAVVFALMFTVTAPVAHAQLDETACRGFEEALGETCDPGSSGGEITDTIDAAINIISIIVGVISVIMIIVGGIKYITSTGDPGSTKSARDTIIYAIVGLVIVAIAQFIVKFVVRALTED